MVIQSQQVNLMSANHLQAQLARRLKWQKQAHKLEMENKELAKYLPMLRKWQANRLETSFARFLDDTKTQPAAHFFLTDLYGDREFLQRDEEAAKILPKMSKLLPVNLLQAAVDAIELSVLSHALDMRMARLLAVELPKGQKLDSKTYQKVYRKLGYPRLRKLQLDLIMDVGYRLDAVVQKHGIAKLLAAARWPARLLGLQHLQGFLERGFAAFNHLGGAKYFLTEIYNQETCISARLMRGDANPFQEPFN
ncbi:MAG TPA: hypothetical protein VN247_01640 [Arenimonas sp.]|nr:hypothetical protein [Arenimonas sp.]